MGQRMGKPPAQSRNSSESLFSCTQNIASDLPILGRIAACPGVVPVSMDSRAVEAFPYRIRLLTRQRDRHRPNS